MSTENSLTDALKAVPNTTAVERNGFPMGSSVTLAAALEREAGRFEWRMGRLGPGKLLPAFRLVVELTVRSGRDEVWVPAGFQSIAAGCCPALSAKWLVFIGHRSYAMYLVQYMSAHAVIAVLPGTTIVGGLLLSLSFAAALVVSDLLYRGFEKPITDWGHRWARAVKQPATPRAEGSHRPLA
jgi:hypothetical protein